MIVTATPEPTAFPPRVRLDIDSQAGEFLELRVLRDGHPIRQQPKVSGLTQTHAYDYEAPFGVPVTYTVEGQIATGAWVTVFSEAWSSLSGWTSFGGSPSVSGGKLVDGRVRRSDITIGTGSVTLNAGSAGNGHRLQFGPVDIDGATDGSRTVSFRGGPAVPVPGTGALTILWTSSTASVTHTGGTVALIPGSDPLGSEIYAQGGVPLAPSGWWTGSLAGFSYSTPSGKDPVAGTATTQLDVDEAWLIHPSQPSLSMPIDDPNRRVGGRRMVSVEASTDDERTYAARQSVFQPNGRREAVVFPLGVRGAGSWTLRLYLRGLDQRDALLNLLDDQAPLLLRSPADADWDLPDGWYAVADLSVRRPVNIAGEQLRLATLPLTRTAEPPVLLAPPFTWGDLMLRGITWGDLLTRTWLDVLMGEV